MWKMGRVQVDSYPHSEGGHVGRDKSGKDETVQVASLRGGAGILRVCMRWWVGARTGKKAGQGSALGLQEGEQGCIGWEERYCRPGQ